MIVIPFIDISVNIILLLSLFIGINRVFFYPAINSLIPILIPKDKLMKGNAINQTVVQFSRVIGQSLGGILFTIFGSSFIFILNGFSFIGSAISEIFIKVPLNKTLDKKNGNFLKNTISGLKYTKSISGLSTLITLLVITNCLFPPFLLSLPYYVNNFLDLSDLYYGYFLGVMGLGALIGSIIFSLIKVCNKERYIIFFSSFILIGILSLLLSIKLRVIFVFIILALFGSLNMFINIIIYSVFQEKIKDEYRGRFYGLLNTSIVTAMPISYILSGLFIDFVNKRVNFIFTFIGIIIMIISLFILKNSKLKIFLKS